jgi:CRISPR/Cas system CMR-associated protein Cmr5 small subunit
MGKIQEISDFVRESALKALRERLIQIGLTPTSIFKTQILFSGVIGAISIANRNIDLVELERKVSGGTSIDGEWLNAVSKYRCSYVIHVQVEGAGKNLEAQVKPVKKGKFRGKIVDFEWGRSELAQSLNNDIDLKDVLFPPWLIALKSSEIRKHERLIKFPDVSVRADGNRQIVIITERRYHESWFSAFPSIGELEAFDRIAQHARRIAQGLTTQSRELKPIDPSLGSEELYQHVDEILYYVWDPLYVSDEPGAREQYSSYVSKMVSMVKSNLSEEQIAEYLEKIEQECKTNSSKHADIAPEYSWPEYLGKMSITERSKWVAEMLYPATQQYLAIKEIRERERKLDSIDRELYKRIDEVLIYVWDPVGVNAGSRDEYLSYVHGVLSLVKSGADKDAIAEHLGTLVETVMGLSRCRERDEKVAEILVKWRQKIYGDNK